MKYLSLQLLDDLYEQTEKTIHTAVTQWQLLPNVRLLAQPGAESWSAAQCLDHLNSYAAYYLPAMEKAIMKKNDTKPGLYFKSGWLGNYFYKLMLPNNNGHPKKKMQSPTNHQPARQVQAAETLALFISHQERLEKIIDSSTKVDLNKVRVPISIAPYITLKLGDTLLFYTAHINRHLQQAQRAIDNTTVPLPGKEYHATVL